MKMVKKTRNRTLDAQKLLIKYTACLTHNDPLVIYNHLTSFTHRDASNIRFMEKVMISKSNNTSRSIHIPQTERKPTRGRKQLFLKETQKKEKQDGNIKINVHAKTLSNFTAMTAPNTTVANTTATINNTPSNSLTDRKNNNRTIVFKLPEDTPTNTLPAVTPKNSNKHFLSLSMKKRSFNIKDSDYQNIVFPNKVVSFCSSNNLKDFCFKNEDNTPSNHLIKKKSIDQTALSFSNVKFSRKKKKQYTVSFVPFMAKILNTFAVENDDQTVIKNYILKEHYEQNESLSNSNNILLSMNQVLNIKSYSVFGIFEGEGNEAHILASCAKGVFVKLLTQTINYEFTSPVLNSSIVYTALTRNNFEVLNTFDDKLRDVIKRYRINKDKTTLSYGIILIIGNKMISMSYNNTKVVMVKQLNTKDIETFSSSILSNKNKKENAINYRIENMTLDVKYMFIGTKWFWDYQRPLGNIIKAVTRNNISLSDKCDLLMRFREKHLREIQERKGFALIIIDFEY